MLCLSISAVELDHRKWHVVQVRWNQRRLWEPKLKHICCGAHVVTTEWRSPKPRVLSFAGEATTRRVRERRVAQEATETREETESWDHQVIINGYTTLLTSAAVSFAALQYPDERLILQRFHCPQQCSWSGSCAAVFWRFDFPGGSPENKNDNNPGPVWIASYFFCLFQIRERASKNEQDLGNESDHFAANVSASLPLSSQNPRHSNQPIN